MNTTETRADRFVRELADLKIPDPASRRSGLWLRVGLAAMAVGLVLGIVAYAMSHNTTDPLEQRDAITLGLAGVAASVVGAALYLRYSLTGFLRYWMARQSYDLTLLADRLLEGDATVTTLRPGDQLASTTGTTRVVVVRITAADHPEISCGGRPMVPAEGARPQSADADAVTLIGKRYVDATDAVELLCTFSGRGELCCDGVPMTLKAAKALPASD